MSSPTLLSFETMPSMARAIQRSFVPRRRPGVPLDQTIPEIEARVANVSVNPELVRRYRQVCALAPGTTLPLALPQMIAGPLHFEMLLCQSFPLSALGMVHVSNRIRSHHPIALGAPLDLRTHVGGHRDVRHGLETDIITEARVDGTLVWESTAAVLFRDKARSQQHHRQARPSSAASAPAAPSGHQVHASTWSLGADLGRRYSRVSGDRNPIHLYPLTARVFGFERPIIHGMWTLARAIGELEDRASDHLPVAPLEVSIRFKRPIMLPGVVRFVAHRQGDALSFGVYRPSDAKAHAEGRFAKLEL